jgi:hypothetical protein
MATFYSNKGQYTDDQIRDFVNTYYNTEQGQKDIQYLVNQGAILRSDDPNVLNQRAAYYGLTQILGMPQSEATAAMAAVFPSGGASEVDALAKVYEKSMLGGVSQDELDRAAGAVGLYETDPFSIERVLESRGYKFGAPGSGELEKGYPSAAAIVESGQRIADAGVGNMIFTPEYNPPGSDTNRYDLAESIVKAPDAAAKAKAIELANAQQAAMNTAAQAAAQAKVDQIMADRAQAMALGLPPSTDMSGLSALSKYDFSKAAPQLRMAGAYAEPLVMPTTRPGLSSFQQTIGSSKGAVRQALQNRLPNQEITDADVNYWATHGGVNAVNQAFPIVGTPGSMPSYTMGRAPTREEAFMRYAFPDGVAGATDIEDNITRGLQYARNLGLNPTETLGLINRALPAGQSITPAQLQAAVVPRAGLLALSQSQSGSQVNAGPSVSFQRKFGTTLDNKPTGVDIVDKSYLGGETNNLLGGNFGIGAGGGVGGLSLGGDSSTDSDGNEDGVVTQIFKTLFGEREGEDAPITHINPLPGDQGGGDGPGNPKEEGEEVVSVRKGGPVFYDKGGDVAYTLADFGISTPQVKDTLGVPRDVMFNPELIAKEKGITRTGLSDLIDLQNLAIRQGRTGREYNDIFSYLADYYGYTPEQFARIEAGEYAGSGRMRPGYSYFAEGGVAKGLGSIAMKGYAQEMAQKGRFGDTMLAHISPDEAQMLKAMGGSGTINPYTGLPEYFSWRKTLKGLAKIAPFVVPFIPGLGLAAKAIISGVAGGLGGEKGFDFKRGLMSGLMSYGIGSAAQNLGLTSGAAPTGAEAAAGAGAAPINPASSLQAGLDFPTTSTPTISAGVDLQPYVPPTDVGSMDFTPANMAATPPQPEPSMFDTAKAKLTSGLETAQAKLDQPIDTLYAVPMAISSAGMVSESDKYNAAVAAQEAEEERKKRLGQQLFAETLGRVTTRAAGGGMMGLSALAAGGATGPANAPRTINGAGDGMSDSVPATIEGIQEARLADGEFVIPADVVADLGNGSSNAGAKKLYAMMDRVRKARHGTTKQPPEVDMGRLMPA